MTTSPTHRLTRRFAGVLLVLFALLGYAADQLLDEDQFAGLVADSVESPEVRDLLATKAVDVALDASDADARLAEALPDDLSLIATPAVELAKPSVADAGAALLGAQSVQDGLDLAARSIHRQTISAVVAEDDTDVIVSALPVLVVVAEEIAGDAGARAVVGLNLSSEVTEVNLGSNTSPLWLVVVGIGALALIAAVLLVIVLIVHVVTAPVGGRLLAVRRLGRTFISSSLVVLVLGWIAVVVVGTVLEQALSTGDAVTFANFSIGGDSGGGGVALASVLVGPLLRSARNMLFSGALIIAATHLLGAGGVAVGARQAVRSRSAEPLRSAVAASLPGNLRRTMRWIWVGLILALLAWPDPTTRVVLTLTAIALAVFATLVVLSNSRPVFVRLRNALGLPTVIATDSTDRSEQVGKARWVILAVAFGAAVIWPSYSTGGLMTLVLLTAGAMAFTFFLELESDEEDEAVAQASAEQAWSTRKKALATGAALATVVLFLGAGSSVPEVSASGLSVDGPKACNGHVELCDRPLDEIALAGTHNSMSANELGWELANHELAIPKQLDGGIRALLIDVLHWTSSDDLSEFQQDPQALAIARAALAGDDAPEDGLWMCHSLCQLGGTPFEDFLADLRVFLETNPDEVIVVVIQDEAPAVDIKAAIERSTLDRFALSHEPGTPWPTLEDMISANTRVVFMAENEADETGWYQTAFGGNVSETGYSYAVVEDFECAANRGGDSGQLFMINHWVETGLPIPAEADTVNSRDVLLDRVAECERERGRRPGIIAVNFWERGDLLAVVDELNAVGSNG